MVAYLQLPVSALPQVDYPTIQVLTFYPGASADVMVSSVTTPLERQFGQMPGLRQMTSTSSFGASLITLQFTLDTSIDVAEQQVQAAINAAGTFLPRDLPSPPIYSKVNPADTPILTLALTSDTLPLTKVQDLADTILAQKISQLTGVGLVSISGGQKPAIRVQANPTKLASYGLGLEDVRTVLGQANVDQAKGSLEGPRQSFTIGANDQLFSSAEYRALVVAYRNGAPVRLADVADVVDGAENVQAGRVDERQARGDREHPAPARRQHHQRGGPHQAAPAPAPRLAAVLGRDHDAHRPDDHDPRLRGGRAVHAGAHGRARRHGHVPVPAQPRRHRHPERRRAALASWAPSASCTCSGYSLDNLSLMALTISTGFVVDDAIVMIENIARYIEEGESPLAGGAQGLRADRLHDRLADRLADRGAHPAALHGRHRGPAVPRVRRHAERRHPGLRGRLADADADDVRQAPAARARGPARPPLPVERADVRGRRSPPTAGRCAWVLRHQPATLVVTVATLVLTIALYVVVPKGFFPVQDTGVILGVTEAPQTRVVHGDGGAPAGARARHPEGSRRREPVVVHRRGRDQHDAEQRAHPDQPQAARRAARRRDRIIRRLQPAIEHVEGITLFMQPVQDLTVENRVSRTQYQYTLEDADARELADWAPRLVERLRGLAGAARRGERPAGRRPAGLARHRPRHASRLGILPQAIDDTLYDAFGQRQVSTIFTQLNQYHVVLEVDPHFQQDPEALKSIYVKSATGAQVPLSAFTRFEPGARAARHQPPGPVPGGHAVVQPGARRLARRRRQGHPARRSRRSACPPAIRASFQGTAAAFQASLANEPLLILAALVTVYIVLGVLYESYIHPITILSTLPSAGVGALLRPAPVPHGPRASSR